MKRLLGISLLALFVLLLPVLAGRAIAAPEGEQFYEESMVDVWVFVDADRNGVYSAGDDGLTDNVVCLTSKNGKFDRCSGTDEGDVFWEFFDTGKFSATVDAGTIPPGHQLNSIRCEHSRSGEVFDGCSFDLPGWATHMKMPHSTRINIFYALVPVE